MKRGALILAGILTLVLILGITGIVFAATAPTSASVTVNEFISVTLDNAPVNFTSMNPGETQNASVGGGFPLNVTIGSDTNVNTNVSTRADSADFTSGSDTFPVSNMEWSATSSFPGTDYTTSDAVVCSGISIGGGTCDIYHQLSIPAAQAAGTYSVDLTISATKA